jgi:anti-sigma factor RsiW
MNPELDAKLSALLDGNLAPEQAAALRAELARSPELAARLAALAAVDESLRELPSRPVPARLRERVRSEVAAPRRVRRWLATAALAAAAAALALLALPLAQPDPRPIARSEPAPAPAAASDLLAEAEDLPVIEVLDLLAELDELETRGSG